MHVPTIDQLNAQLDRLAAFDAGPFPVLSLYLDLRPNERGRDNFEPFLRKELADRVRGYPAGGPERESLEKDSARIRDYVSDLDRSLNGLAVFACSGAGLFETVPLVAPIEEHRLYISDQPHLYPLAKVLEQYPRYVALLADSNSARVFVFAANATEKTDRIENVKTKRHKVGGWSQARFQRHVENYHLRHAKEVVDEVVRIVSEEGIDRIVVAAEERIRPVLVEHFPKDVAERIVDLVALDIRAPEGEVLDRTIAALKEKDAETDRERVEALLGAYRSRGLACVGVEATRRAFELGQVDELLIAAAPADEKTADELVLKARQTSAKLRIIEDATLLEPVGGVGAFLRFLLLPGSTNH